MAVDHEAGMLRLADSYRRIPAGEPVRLAKQTSNLFRERAKRSAPGLDVSGLSGVIAVDPQSRTAHVGGMCTYEDLVAATLPHGLTPLVVPQLKTITLGGAVTGMGVESASFRNGLPHESVLEADVFTASGEVVTARPDGEHSDLYFGFPNSYGTLGYATRLKIELEPVSQYVALRSVRFDDLGVLSEAVASICAEKAWEREAVDYLDGVVFSTEEAYLLLGRRTEEPGPTSDYTGQKIFYRSIRHARTGEAKRDRLTTHDYLWRWDTDWFWCSRAFGAQHPVVRRLWPKRWRRSSVYWKLMALDRRFCIADRIERRAGRPALERVVQDVEVPVERLASFVTWFLAETGIEPVWLCPIVLREPHPNTDPARPWPLYPLESGKVWVNVGFWSAVSQAPGDPSRTNRLIEQTVAEHGGHKSLYSESFYTPEDFEQLYGGQHYRDLKARYDPEGRFLTLYQKTVRNK
ncbi:FAD linked oxidase domain protein [Segniliparus rotundus DSM 44985]|uniref:Delta(24)-sterol reductase n=1 Tax=Segniliparus rotundus (strain ATCC BAA-972 / CDC 1076 / CIP 108378 / DSM 44985 / JCM 13578) TaxID=640132 RepID=D6ZFE5_SEGRD|nr:FAD-binding oxidoreductase [Segniliparus rotundus]ADG97669.1 FAD linked oxidase domain protein [Segniliparus rotundus DSM 44985]